MEQGGGYRPGVQTELGHDPGHRHRVRDIGLPGLAHLACMSRFGRRTGPGDQLPVGVRGQGPTTVLGAEKSGQQVVEQRRAAERRSLTLDGDHQVNGTRPRRGP